MASLSPTYAKKNKKEFEIKTNLDLYKWSRERSRPNISGLASFQSV